MPLTDDGERRLTLELARAERRVVPPALVWVFDPGLLAEVRGALYGCRAGAPPRALVVTPAPGPHPADRVEWVCAPFVRPRRE